VEVTFFSRIGLARVELNAHVGLSFYEEDKETSEVQNPKLKSIAIQSKM
jgi:hypothetical protein